MKKEKGAVAYFSMEFAFNDKMHNFAGGLGVLAADIMLSAADLNENVVGVSLIYHYDDDQDRALDFTKFMEKCEQEIELQIEDRMVKVVIWKMEIRGSGKGKVPIYFLSTYNKNNKPWDRDITKTLYPGHAYTRLCQEAVLGIGGVKALEALGYNVSCYHLNEGHAALSTLEILSREGGDIERTRSFCTFTTHTPVASGHDYFDYDLVEKTIGSYLPSNIHELASSNSFGMTELALHLTKRKNSVSWIHNNVCRQMFPGYEFENVTNGIYHNRWVGKCTREMFDKYLEGWSRKPEKLRLAISALPLKEIAKARAGEKKIFLEWLNSHPEYFPVAGLTKNDFFTEDILTLGFARRIVPYKRADLIFRHIDRLREIGFNKLQLVFSGNQYENDNFSKGIMSEIAHRADELRGQIKIALIPKYNIHVAKRLVTGCDGWLNNPLPPHEASGTSGMKAALNGALNISILDGWWPEAYNSDMLAGWGFGSLDHAEGRDDADSLSMLNAISGAIDCYYNKKDVWLDRVRHSISTISFFNTNRTVVEYKKKIWQA